MLGQTSNHQRISTMGRGASPCKAPIPETFAKHVRLTVGGLHQRVIARGASKIVKCNDVPYRAIHSLLFISLVCVIALGVKK